MLLHKLNHRRRSGFTLVELLVAAAVSILLMVILTQAFAAGLEMFRKLRAQGNMQERLRMTSITLRDDLTRPHFNAAGAGPGGQNLLDDRLSDQNLNNAYSGGWLPPGNGFVRIWQGQMRDLSGNPIIEPPFGVPGGNLGIATPLPFAFEGTDSDGLMFCRATTHLLHLTVRRRGTGLDDMFRVREANRAIANPQPPFTPFQFPRDYIFPSDYRENVNATDSYFTSRWGEVAYFLVPTGEFTTGNQVPRFTLHRRVKAIVPPQGSGVPGGNVPATPLATPTMTSPSHEMSVRTVLPQLPGTTPPNDPPPGPYYNRPGTLTQPRFRSYMLPAPNTVNSYTGHTPMLAGLMENTAPNRQFWTSNRYPALADDLVGGVGNADAGNDILLHDVISFEIKAWWEAPNFVPGGGLTAAEVQSLQPRLVYNYGGTIVANTDYPFDYLPFSTKNAFFANRLGLAPVLNEPLARVFDTWSDNGPYGRVTPAGNPRPPGPPPSPPGQPPGPPPGPPGSGGGVPEWQRTDFVSPQETPARLPIPIRIKALQITIRVWDMKSEQTRRITIIQDM